jgi:hypothetical protein
MLTNFPPSRVLYFEKIASTQNLASTIQSESERLRCVNGTPHLSKFHPSEESHAGSFGDREHFVAARCVRLNPPVFPGPIL